MNDVNVDGYPFLAALTGEEQATFRALGPAAAARIVLAGKRVYLSVGVEAAIDAVRAQLGPLSRGETPPPLPVDAAAAAALPSSDPASPNFPAWCASQTPQPAECDVTRLPKSDPRSPGHAAWCEGQTPRPADCPVPGTPGTPAVAGSEFPVSDPRNPGYAAYCASAVPSPCGDGAIVPRDPATPATTTAPKDEGIIARVLRDPPWPLFVVAGAFVGWWAAGVVKGNPAKASDDA